MAECTYFSAHERGVPGEDSTYFGIVLPDRCRERESVDRPGRLVIAFRRLDHGIRWVGAALNGAPWRISAVPLQLLPAVRDAELHPELLSRSLAALEARLARQARHATELEASVRSLHVRLDRFEAARAPRTAFQ